MSALQPSPELMRSLGSVTRGLSCVFWGLPLALVVSVQTAKTPALDGFGSASFVLPIATTCLLLHGLHLLARFRPRERVWTRSLDRTLITAWINAGLSPFLYWFHKVPDSDFFRGAVTVFAFSGLVFVFNLNGTLNRLAAMLPDEPLRHETRFFTQFNRYMLVAIPGLVGLFILLQQVSRLPRFVIAILLIADSLDYWLLVFLFLFPLAMTMTLVWKIKETVFNGVFSGGN